MHGNDIENKRPVYSCHVEVLQLTTRASPYTVLLYVEQSTKKVKYSMVCNPQYKIPPILISLG